MVSYNSEISLYIYIYFFFFFFGLDDMLIGRSEILNLSLLVFCFVKLGVSMFGVYMSKIAISS
jgi:hypothetical protein